MSQSKKLSFFIGLGCKPLDDVILHCPDWTMHVKDSTIHRLEQSSEVRRAMHNEDIYLYDTAKEWACNHAIHIEAIPKKLTGKEAFNNILRMSRDGKA